MQVEYEEKTLPEPVTFTTSKGNITITFRCANRMMTPDGQHYPIRGIRLVFRNGVCRTADAETVAWARRALNGPRSAYFRRQFGEVPSKEVLEKGKELIDRVKKAKEDAAKKVYDDFAKKETNAKEVLDEGVRNVEDIDELLRITSKKARA